MDFQGIQKKHNLYSGQDEPGFLLWIFRFFIHLLLVRSGGKTRYCNSAANSRRW